MQVSMFLSRAATVACAIVATTLVFAVQGPLHAAPAAPSIAGNWNVDPVHTSIEFSILHMGLTKVTGRFTDLAGTIVADPSDLAKSSVSITIQATSVDTQNSQRDAHLRTKEFFDVATYPTITFQSTKIIKDKNGTYKALGTLTIHGVSRQIVLPFKVAGPVEMMGASHIGLSTQVVLDRTTFGVGDPKFDMMLGHDVDVSINLEAVKKP